MTCKDRGWEVKDKSRGGRRGGEAGRVMGDGSGDGTVDSLSVPQSLSHHRNEVE